MTIEELLDIRNGELTELQQRFVDNAHDADERHRLADQIRLKRNEITELYDRLPV